MVSMWSRGPVFLINKFIVDPENVNKFLKAWARMPSTLGANQDSFLHCSIEELEEAVYSSTMHGSLASSSRML